MTVVSGVVVLVGAVSGVGASLHEAGGPEVSAAAAEVADAAGAGSSETAPGAEAGGPVPDTA
ncbi:hypothetical protein [Streptomyces sp. B8F3]|uniref:hypothetical protein n=1 Tax=unclassified Streptomyces TaxID=2593676 RepID=UPI00325E620A